MLEHGPNDMGYDFSIGAFDRAMEDALSGQELDFCAVLGLTYDEKLSITAKYAPADRACPWPREKGYVCLDGSDIRSAPVVVTDPEEWYYGVSPSLNKIIIKKAISSLRFASPEGLDAFIAEYASWFSLHADQAGFLLGFARNAVLAFASRFGIRLRIPGTLLGNAEERDDLSCFVPPAAKAEKDEKGEGGAGEEDILLTIYGCPTERMLKVLAKWKYRMGEDGFWTAGGTGETITEIYSDPGNIRLIVGKVFYSGVLLKPVEIVDGSSGTEWYENSPVIPIVIRFERSTFATVISLDNDLSDHPLLKEYAEKEKVKESIGEMLALDDKAKSDLISGLREGGGDRLGVVNTYLDRCFNVNQICVSGNVVTRDGMLVLGLRPQDEGYDGGKIYPGVNGNAELADSKVEFYSDSVYEDYPTMSLRDDRMDFLGEIAREAYAELRVDIPRLEWKCFGLIMVGSEPGRGSRRMQFNILFEQHSGDTLWDIMEESEKATEAGEHSKLIGVDVHCHKNLFERIIDGALSALIRIAEGKDVWESVLVLWVFLSNLFRRNGEKMDWADILTLVLALIVLLASVYKVGKWAKKACSMHKQVCRIHLYRDKGDSREKIKAGLKDYTCHPAAYASLKAYADGRMYDRVKEEKKKAARSE